MTGVTDGAILTVWGTSLAIFLVVGGVVAALLALILRTVGRIHDVVADIWTVGKGIANNTIHIPLLITTNRVVAAIGRDAGGILAAAARLERHAETCPGCPACVLAPSKG